MSVKNFYYSYTGTFQNGKFGNGSGTLDTDGTEFPYGKVVEHLIKDKGLVSVQIVHVAEISEEGKRQILRVIERMNKLCED